VEGEVDGAAVLGDDGGWGDESLKGDLLGFESGAEKLDQKCMIKESHERFHGRG
jgi:hypothetical protein